MAVTPPTRSDVTYHLEAAQALAAEAADKGAGRAAEARAVTEIEALAVAVGIRPAG